MEKKHSRNSENPVLREDREAVIMIQVKLQADKAVKMQEIFLLLSTEKTCMIGENLLNFCEKIYFRILQMSLCKTQYLFSYRSRQQNGFFLTGCKGY